METTQYKLTKASGEAGIRQYFEAIVRLEREQKEQFPIDLDTVWELAYERKHKAIEVLKSAFIEGTDFKALTQKVQAGPGTSTKVQYYLTVPAMEWFVARRVPAVFAVYREVFHRTAKKHAADPRIGKMREYLCGVIGAPISINDVPYWPYSHMMTAAGYKHRPNRLYKLANEVIDKNQLFPFIEDPMFVEQYGRIWARAEVFTALQKRKQAWLALDEAQQAVKMIMQLGLNDVKI